MSKLQQTQKESSTITLKQNLFTRISKEYSEYLATYPGAQAGVIMAVLLMAVSIAFFLLQNT